MDEATRNQSLIVNAMVRCVVDEATGISEPPLRRYIGPSPDARFWLGWLGPESAVLHQERSRETLERFTPAAQGFSFRVAGLPVELELTVSFALWLALHPTFEEQVNSYREPVGGNAAQGAGAGHAAQAGPDRGIPIAQIRIKVPVGPLALRVSLDGAGRRSIGADDLRTAIRRALDSLPAGATPYRPRRAMGKLPRDPDLRDRASWAAWERENLDGPVVPEWRPAVDLEVAGPEGGPYEVLAMIVNRSPDLDGQFVDRDRAMTFPRPACDPNLYEVQLRCTPSSPILFYELEQIPDSYRYDRRVAALGLNTAADEDGPAIRTAFAAIAHTNRVYPRTTGPDGIPIDTSFRTLRTDPLPALERLVEQARRWTDEHWGAAALDTMEREGAWVRATREKAEEDARAAREELEWIEAGVHQLRGGGDLLEAFKLANETMELVANGRYDRWYPFQLAFILGCLLGVVDPAAAPSVDILWFRTGGGKTEAYLGLNVLYLFYTRLRGRMAGAQTWARFPLRLLSLQQTQRFADSVILAEMVRRQHQRTNVGEPFAVGYYVGAGNTPNKIELPGSRFYSGWDPLDTARAETCRVLEACPACRSPDRPRVRFDQDSHTMIHECVNPRCVFFGDRLPVYVVDDDIYRWAPSVLVGTVDKLAQLGQQANFRILLGKAMARCPKHGFTAFLDRCSHYGCRETLRPVPPGFGGVTFEIQDELHLLNESLGALDGNYETLFQHVAAESGIPALRIIASTATIEGYRNQSEHLYQRTPRRFPAPGPTKEESFWAFEQRDDPLRTYVALLPRGTTMLNAAFSVAQTHWRFVEEGIRDQNHFTTRVLGLDAGRSQAVADYLKNAYEVMTTYALRKQELERFAKDVAENAEMCPGAGNYDSITGDVEFWDIRSTLDRLEHPSANADERIRVLGATSAISHGVDIDRLNFMTMLGMPKQTAEFIQATARVGRKYPGAVFALINPMRERDVSHFRYFRKYAEYLDRLVEPVPVNRESLPVLERVLPGGLMALLLQVDEPQWLYPGGAIARPRRDRLWKVREVARAIDDGFITAPALVERLMQAFAVDPADPRHRDHRRAVETFVEINLRTFQLQRGAGTDTIKEIDPSVPRSLRDVETLITIMGDR